MIIVRLLILVVAVVAVPTFTSAQTFTTYDGFSLPLDPTLWNGFDSNSNTALISNLETQRAIVRPDPSITNRVLQLGLRTVHPGTGSDTGEAGQGRQRIRVMREDILAGTVTVTGLRTKVTIVSTKATPCPTATDATRAMAQVSFFFFNTGSSAGAGDATGDVFAGVNVEQSSTLGRIIGAFLGHCTNAACSILVTTSSRRSPADGRPGSPFP